MKQKLAYVFSGNPHDNIFVPLPRNLRRSSGKCACDHCKGKTGFWDTLALPPKTAQNQHPYAVHYPELRKRVGKDVEHVPMTAALSHRITEGFKEIAEINKNVRAMKRVQKRVR